MTPAPQPRKTEEGAEDDYLHERFDMMSPRIPGSFDFEDYGGGAAGAGIVSIYDSLESIFLLPIVRRTGLEASRRAHKIFLTRPSIYPTRFKIQLTPQTQLE